MSIDNGDHARSLMQRILRLHEEVDTIKGDIREVYAEARSMGYNKAAMGEAIRIIRKREKGSAAFEERTAIVELYLSTFDQPSHVPARERMREVAEPTPRRDHGPVTQEEHHVDRSACAQPHSAEGEPAIPSKAGDAGTGQAVHEPNAAVDHTEQPSGAGTGSAVRTGAPILAKPYDPGPIPAFLDRRVKREQVEA